MSSGNVSVGASVIESAIKVGGNIGCLSWDYKNRNKK